MITLLKDHLGVRFKQTREGTLIYRGGTYRMISVLSRLNNLPLKTWPKIRCAIHEDERVPYALCVEFRSFEFLTKCLKTPFLSPRTGLTYLSVQFIMSILPGISSWSVQDNLLQLELISPIPALGSIFPNYVLAQCVLFQNVLSIPIPTLIQFENNFYKTRLENLY